MVGVIDYEAGNTLSVIKALEYLGAKVCLSNKAKELKECDKIVFPGVGAYYDAMLKLKKYELIPVIKDLVNDGKPFLGICLGMQLIFNESYETIGCEDGQDTVKGLSLLNGKIIKFDSSLAEKEGLKIPQIGWNSISIKNKESKLLNGIKDGSYVYFVHSYHLICDDKNDAAATAFYTREFDAAIEHENIYGCQFHPEKSGNVGLAILNNFLKA